MASIIDVAKRANVSVATVSRMLNGERNVAPATAQAVENAIKELGYVPRAIRPGPKPQSRRGIHTGTIAFLSVGPVPPSEMYRMPAFPALLGGIQQGIEKNGMELALAHLPEGNTVPPVLARRRADGVLLFGSETLSGRLQQAVSRVPTVWCYLRGTSLPDGSYDHVLYDNTQVGRLAAEYLLDRGHRNTMFVSASSSHRAFAERRDQFLRVTREQGVCTTVVEGPLHDSTELIAPSTRAETTDRAIEALLALPDRPTGIFVSSDDHLVGICSRLRQVGIEPGRDVDLIGCNNDTPYLDQIHPRPATVDIRLELVGERAVDQLLWRISHPMNEGQIDVLIRPVIIPAETD